MSLTRTLLSTHRSINQSINQTPDQTANSHSVGLNVSLFSRLHSTNIKMLFITILCLCSISLTKTTASSKTCPLAEVLCMRVTQSLLDCRTTDERCIRVLTPNATLIPPVTLNIVMTDSPLQIRTSKITQMKRICELSSPTSRTLITFLLAGTLTPCSHTSEYI